MVEFIKSPMFDYWAMGILGLVVLCLFIISIFIMRKVDKMNEEYYRLSQYKMDEIVNFYNDLEIGCSFDKVKRVVDGLKVRYLLDVKSESMSKGKIVKNVEIDVDKGYYERPKKKLLNNFIDSWLMLFGAFSSYTSSYNTTPYKKKYIKLVFADNVLMSKSKSGF